MPEGRLICLFAETPLHPGTGQTTGIVDLPIQRERHTGFPKIDGSGLKGALRASAEARAAGAGQNSKALTPGEITSYFGPETNAAHEHAGALSLTDGRTLAFPVRSLAEVFVWVTCPQVVSRLARDRGLAGLPPLNLGKADQPAESQAWVGADSALMAYPELVLEELLFAVTTNPYASAVAAAVGSLLPADLGRVASHLVLLRDDDFSHFVRHATEVSARIHLTPGKTTGEWTDDQGQKHNGNLWYEETLPAQSVLYSLALAAAPRKRTGAPNEAKTAGDVLKRLAECLAEHPYLQVGGNETVGQGWCHLTLNGGPT